MHDAWGAYGKYGCTHSLCNAHNLRELLFLQEELGQAWAGRMGALLLESKGEVAVGGAAAGADGRRLASGELRGHEDRYEALVREGMAANAPPSKREGKRGRPKRSRARQLVDRLDLRRGQVLLFMYDFAVPFDNNLAERDIRMDNVKQKISGCFRASRA